MSAGAGENVTDTPTRTFDPVAWYKQQQYKGAHDIDPRCLWVLNAWENLYNIPRDEWSDREDGGFLETGTPGAVAVRCPPGVSMSTFDDSALTRLVIAAHVHCCRVGIHTTEEGGIAVTVHPRSHDGSLFERHPDANDLLRMVKEAQRG